MGNDLGLAGLEKLLDLGPLDGALEDDFTGAEGAGAIGSDGLLANVIHGGFEDPVAALGAFANRFLAGEIHFGHDTVGIGLILAEIKFRLQLGSHLDDGGKWKPLLAAESLQRTHLPLLDQFLDRCVE